MRSNAREAALNIIFPRQFKEESTEGIKKGDSKKIEM